MAWVLKIAGALLLVDLVKAIFSAICELILKLAGKDLDDEQIKVDVKGSCVVIDINAKKTDE